MIRDAMLTFSDAQAFTDTSAKGTNVLDWRTVRDMMKGGPIWLIVSCVVTMVNASGNGTVAVKLQGDSDSAFGSATDLLTVGTFANNTKAGAKMFKIPIPPGLVTERYMDVYYTLDGTISAGSFDAFLTDRPDDYTQFADNLDFNKG